MKPLSNRTKKNSRTISFLALLTVIVGLILFFSLKTKCSPESYNPTKALDIPFVKQGELTFISLTNSDTLAVIEIEIAENMQQRARGLMYRKSIPANGGMLFIHDYEEMQSFWMKNTYISLDMIFINSDKEIVTIHHNTSPLKEWSYSSAAPVLYVVEVNRGFCKQNNIEEGDLIEYSRLEK